MKSIRMLLVGLNLLAAASSLAADALSQGRVWGVENRGEMLVLRLRGEQVAEFVYRDAKVPRPFFANLRAPGGVAVTRNHPPIAGADATDHDTMHPGVWLAFGDLSGQDFWRNKARMEHVRFVEPPWPEKERLTFATECRLLDSDGATLGTMASRFKLTALTNAWLLVWEADLQAGHAGLIFGDQEEMGFGVRVATPLTEKNGGVITSGGGAKTAKDTWGKTHHWCDYSGVVDGRRAGVTLMTHPDNFRPSWFHNRDYGLMVANPFGRKSMNQGEPSRVLVQKGEHLRLRFGVLLHSAPTEKDVDLEGAYRCFVGRN